MKKLPYIEVSFIIEGENFGLEEFTREMEILPSETRGLDDWPSVIKNHPVIPKDLRPRCMWCICQSEDFCASIKSPINKIKAQLEGKEQVISEFCKKYNLKKYLSIVVHAEAMKMPECVLATAIVSYFGMMNVEIGFDIYTY